MDTGGAIVITGAGGFFGWHLRCRLAALHPDAEVWPLDRAAFADDAELSAALGEAGAVVHLAGANRGSHEEVAATNVELARRLVKALESSGSAPVLVYANSVHAERDTAYGRSKREAAELLRGWGEEAGAPVADIRFPNLFGECGRPDYNSAVATFCRDLAEGRPSSIDPGGVTELLHVQTAAAAVLEAISARRSGPRTLEGMRVSVPDLYGRLARLRDGYHGAHFPEMADELDRQLFNVLRAAMLRRHTPITLPAHCDHRGAFAEVARGRGATQTSFSTTGPGVTRGGHFHLEKIERFTVVAGRAVIRLRRLFAHEVLRYEVCGDTPVAIDMPPLHTHDITNIGDEPLLTIFWAHDHFDPTSPDTFPEPVDVPPPDVAGVGG